MFFYYSNILKLARNDRTLGSNKEYNHTINILTTADSRADYSFCQISKIFVNRDAQICRGRSKEKVTGNEIEQMFNISLDIILV